MNYPISFKGDTTLNTGRCTVCPNPIGDYDVVFLTVGATQDCCRDDTVDLSNTIVLFSLAWEGTEMHQGDGFEVVADAQDGQCTFHFCSTACRRRFLNGAVDHLEELIRNRQSQPAASADPAKRGPAEP